MPLTVPLPYSTHAEYYTHFTCVSKVDGTYTRVHSCSLFTQFTHIEFACNKSKKNHVKSNSTTCGANCFIAYNDK